MVNRAGGAPIGRAINVIVQIIEDRQRTVTVTRPSKNTGSMGEIGETTSTFEQELWLFSPAESVNQLPAGEDISGVVGALGIDGIDLIKDDRVTYGGLDYEVNAVEGVPEDNPADGTKHAETEYFEIDLVRRD